MRRPLRLALVAGLAGSALLAGCGEEALPSPSPRPTTEVVPVLNSAQADRILARVAPGVQAADAAKDATLLANVADGPALAGRTAAYRLSTADPALPMPSPIGEQRLSAAVPSSQGWPRTALMVTRTGEEDPLPEVLLLTQQNVRDPYKLTAAATMIPRATFPVLPALRDGVETVPVDDGTDLVASPQDAMASYAKALSEGTQSPELPKFTSSPMTTEILTRQDESRTALAGPSCPDCFAVTFTHTPNLENTWAFRTEDGGVFVLGQVDSTTVMTANGGAQTTLSQELRAASGTPVLTSRGTFVYQQMIGLFVPPSGPRATISPIAYDRVAVSGTIG